MTGALLVVRDLPGAQETFIAIDADGDVVAYNGHVDLGTGIGTALGQIVAEELQVAFDRVTLVLGDPARTPNQGATIASETIQVSAIPLRHAAATDAAFASAGRADRPGAAGRRRARCRGCRLLRRDAPLRHRARPPVRRAAAVARAGGRLARGCRRPPEARGGATLRPVRLHHADGGGGRRGGRGGAGKHDRVAPLTRAWVNNGGDIALHLARGRSVTVGMVARPEPRAPTLFGSLVIADTDPTRGIATSGRYGRSFSRGIADAVTVLARTAAMADAAATVVANAVDLPAHPGVLRHPANTLQPDSDLGDILVTRGVPPR